MTPILYELPFPPSVNRYWRNVGRTLLSETARKFHAAAKIEIAIQTRRMSPMPRYITWPVSVTIVLHQPNRHKRDLDNMAKAILDALTHAGVWADDSLVHDLRLLWGEPVRGGRAKITIGEPGTIPPAA